ncbi:General stress protein 69 [Anaerohalosphaera lusitana]|uniref:General stress protein 69 n=1 Tax=Anaerohalosphaera lusitana TaxID=1936003 RepID=A0A1U9NHK5_9BACT|nr:aldo/keto reductase [Anaerohalosphaera lusitana]AQT67257.1 General stress protein 69 [Anaerohalosphaera lusitana]
MKTRQLGDTDLKLTTIGLGTWAIGGSWQFGWGHQDDQDSIGAIVDAVEKGINWIDTAPIYGCGHSEEIVGKALKETRQNPIIATKCGLLWDDKRRKHNNLDADSIMKECHDSLKRLGISTIDLYQMHWPQPDRKIEEAWEAMAKLKKKGDVRHIGVSNFSVPQLKRIMQIEKPASLQPPYSMIDRSIEQEILPFCGENDIGVVCYSPMQKGLLTGKYTPEKIGKLPPDDHRHRDSDFAQPKLDIHLELVEKLKPIAQRNHATLAQLAIAWVFNQPHVTSAIVGARKPHQVDDNVKAGSWEISEQDMQEISRILEKHDEKLHAAV